jgi:NADP-dependent 3-hydroxy acid dehydrogenase YdfG
MTMNTPDTNGRSEVVVITGATAGVGRATAHAFAKRGAKIGLLARGTERLDATRKEVENLGGKALCVPTDVARYEQVESAAAAIEDAFGPIDIWINNAMTSVFAEFSDIEPDEFRRVTDVVYHGKVYGTMVALKRMLARDRGTIIQVGSALAYRGIPLQSAYCGAKHAVQGMLDSVRSELLHNKSNVRMSMVQLPAINTPQFHWVRTRLPKKAQPVPPIFQPEMAAESIVRACDEYRREWLVGWPTVEAVVGNKMLPGLGDWYLARAGYDGQMREEDEEEGRPDNLFEPVPGDFGTHGGFDDRSKETSLQWELSKRRGMASLFVGGILGILGGLALARSG